MYRESAANMGDMEASTQLLPQPNGTTPQLLCVEAVGEAQKICYMEKVGYGVIVPTISFIGIVFNVMNLVVLRSRKLQESTYTYLTGLAIADLSSLFFFGVNCIGRGHYPGHYGWRVFEVYLYWPLGTITTVASVMLTVTVTVERFVFIYRPHQARSWCVPRVARWITFVVSVTCALCNIPRFFLFTIDRTGKLEYTPFGKSAFYIVYSWLHFMIISVGSALVLIIFNVLLIVGIHRTNKRRHCMVGRHRNSMLRERQDETRLTKTLIAVIFLFIVGEIPSALASRSIVVGIIGKGDTSILNTFGYKVSVLVATILVVNQHSLNFVIYCVFNRKFWAVFKRKMCPCIMKRIKTTHSSTCSQVALPLENHTHVNNHNHNHESNHNHNHNHQTKEQEASLNAWGSAG